MLHRILTGGILAAVLGLTASFATAETFMLVPGIAGDSTAKSREGWIQIARVDWQVDAGSSWTRGGGVAVGKPSPGPVSFKIPFGPWSTAFLRAIASGATLGTGGPIVVDQVTGDGRLVLRMRLEGFFVTKYQVGLASAERPQDLLEGVFKTLRMEAYAVGADNKPAPTVVEWDVPTLLVK